MYRTLKIFVTLIVYFTVGATLSASFNPKRNCAAPLGNVCVNIRECEFFVDLLDKSPIPRPRHVIKIIRDHHCGFQGDIPKVCCFTTEESANTEDVTNAALLAHKNIASLPLEGCGLINEEFRIINGHQTVIYEFPWMALIAYESNSGIAVGCGGTLINDRYVLTAAHCLLNLTVAWVRLGEHNIETVQDCNPIKGICAPPTLNIEVEKTIIHPDYFASSYENDIALTRLANNVDFQQPNIQPICLPHGENTKVNLNDRFAIISGWGITESGFKSMELLKAYIPIIPNDSCQEMYKQRLQINPGQICTGGFKGRDSCGGDSGGPLMSIGRINGTAQYMQYGIISFGPKHCGADEQPGVYTRVTYYLKWILDNLDTS